MLKCSFCNLIGPKCPLDNSTPKPYSPRYCFFTNPEADYKSLSLTCFAQRGVHHQSTSNLLRLNQPIDFNQARFHPQQIKMHTAVLICTSIAVVLLAVMFTPAVEARALPNEVEALLQSLETQKRLEAEKQREVYLNSYQNAYKQDYQKSYRDYGTLVQLQQLHTCIHQLCSMLATSRYTTTYVAMQ